MRSFLVYPTYIVFPNLMPTVQMMDVLHRGQDNLLQKKRLKFFWILFVGICKLFLAVEFSLVDISSCSSRLGMVPGVHRSDAYRDIYLLSREER